MEVLKFPHPALFEVCKEVTIFNGELVTLLDGMWETMVTNNGIGLASNQVGLNYQMFTMLAQDGSKRYVINPKIVEKSVRILMFEEGCLSAPGDSVITGDRPAWTKLQYQNEFGESIIETFFDIQSVCVNHELEHLQGLAFFQSKNVPKDIRKGLLKKWGLK